MGELWRKSANKDESGEWVSYGGSRLWRMRETASYGGEESKLGGKKGKRKRDGGENGRGGTRLKIIFFSFSFGLMRFNHFHPMDEKKWRHGSEGGIVEFSIYIYIHVGLCIL